MHKAASAWLAILLVWPLVSYADEVEVPEVGVRLTALPEGAQKPQVTQQPGASEVTTQVGDAVLSIYRETAPAPAGADVADPNYRALLDARFDKSLDSKTQGAPTNVGGHSGWTVVEARPSVSETSAATVYTCVTYVIVDQHLYRLTVRATSVAGRPHEFDALVATLSKLKFEPAQQSPLPASQSAATFEGGYARTGYVRAGMSGRITCEACSPPT
jgi:hypothetical protein